MLLVTNIMSAVLLLCCSQARQVEVAASWLIACSSAKVCDTRLRNKSNPISINNHFKPPPLPKAGVWKEGGYFLHSSISKSSSYFHFLTPFLHLNVFSKNYSRNLYMCSGIFYRGEKWRQHREVVGFHKCSRSWDKRRFGEARQAAAVCGQQIAGLDFFQKTFCHIWHKPGSWGWLQGGGGGCALLSTCQEEEQEDKEEVKEVENEQAPHLPASHHPLSTC